MTVAAPSKLVWAPEDNLYRAVRCALRSKDSTSLIRKKLGLSYKTFKTIAEHILGSDGYKTWAQTRKTETAIENAKAAHAALLALSPEERTARAERLFGGTCALEAAFASQIRQLVDLSFEMNKWQAVPINGRMAPREADIKIQISDGRKVVVLCDGEAFHGPRYIFGDPTVRIRDDVETAEAYYSLGYSVLRYSESEIHSGWAVQHLLETLRGLHSTTKKLYRTWFPPIERSA